jgi:S-adenosylmethionine:diacylglycerol 3-amino-3-carboxypropyl transferase
MLASNYVEPSKEDSAEDTKNFFDRYFKKQLSFPASQIDAIVGYFLKRGFEESAAKSLAIILLSQSRIDNVNAFQLVDTLNKLTDVQLNTVVTQILNTYREKTSALGFKKEVESNSFERRNIIP